MVWNLLFYEIVFIIMMSSHCLASRTSEEVFTHIYTTKLWGTNEHGEGISGGGSTLDQTKLYREFLQTFLREHNIHSVVDVGCGDWTFSKAIDWTGIAYIGYDVVGFLIDKNNAKYGTQSIQFIKGDATATDLPAADLLICKDVLQHLPNADIAKFLRQLRKFKYCLITNDIDLSKTNNNLRIVRGEHHLVDLTMPPFNLRGEKVLTYESGPNIKQVLLVQF
jgi:SAM-dependent methyltransferase